MIHTSETIGTENTNLQCIEFIKKGGYIGQKAPTIKRGKVPDQDHVAYTANTV